MSWETVAIGHILFNREKLRDKRIDEILNDLAEALEIEFEDFERYEYRDKSMVEYSFSSLNLLSHVEGAKIKAVIEKHQQDIAEFGCSVYYLNEPQERIILRNGELDAELIPF